MTGKTVFTGVCFFLFWLTWPWVAELWVGWWSGGNFPFPAVHHTLHRTLCSAAATIVALGVTKVLLELRKSARVKMTAMSAASAALAWGALQAHALWEPAKLRRALAQLSGNRSEFSFDVSVVDRYVFLLTYSTAISAAVIAILCWWLAKKST